MPEIHGESNTKLYGVWLAMRRRCYLESCADYKNYGERGIAVCEEWKYSYVAFRNWSIANGYKEGLEIDRKDTNGNYEPYNCRWTTKLENARNKRSTVFLEIDGETKTLQEWSEKYELPYETIRHRYRCGLRGEGLLKPLNKNNPPTSKPKIFVEINGEKKSLNEWAKVSGINPKTISWRYHTKGLRGEDLIAKTK